MKRFLTTSVIPKIDFNNFVPQSKQPTLKDIELLQNWINDSKKLLVLTGAGLSTESGIPDYRSANVGLYARTNRRPVQYLEFVRNANARQRYWARNFVGWPQFSSFIPNVNHIALTEWEKKGLIHHLVTQNVDRLHSKAGSEKVVELHGSTHRVICLSCDLKMSRWKLQDIIIDLNKGWSRDISLGSAIAPDGDVLLTEEQVQNFKVPPCPNCGGILKPDVIFFGDNVQGKLVDYVYKLVDESESLLVAGSSLHVYSGYRFVSRARSIGKRIAIINIGPTRADDLAELKIDAQCGNILPKIQI